MYKTPV